MEWIKCSERLPKKGQEIDVWQIDNIFKTGYREINVVYNGKEFFGIDKYGLPYRIDNKITHWREKPQPPKQ